MALGTRAQSRSSIEPLRLEDVRKLRPGWRARLNATDIHDSLVALPDRSVWNPETHEYAIVNQWRNRDDVLQIADLVAVRAPEELVIAASQRGRDLGAELTVMVEIDETRRPAFFERCGFEHLENVVTFELDRTRVRSVTAAAGLSFHRVDITDPVSLEALLAIDNAAFPWIWRNVPREFETYARTNGVEIYLGFDQGEPVSYAGITAFPAWGHLDRIAVQPGLQGRGYGLFTLAHAVSTMLDRGSKRVGLSTQSNNHRSRKLYEQFGFVRTASNDYDLWGDTLLGGNAHQEHEIQPN